MTPIWLFFRLWWDANSAFGQLHSRCCPRKLGDVFVRDSHGSGCGEGRLEAEAGEGGARAARGQHQVHCGCESSLRALRFGREGKTALHFCFGQQVFMRGPKLTSSCDVCEQWLVLNRFRNRNLASKRSVRSVFEGLEQNADLL